MDHGSDIPCRVGLRVRECGRRHRLKPARIVHEAAHDCSGIRGRRAPERASPSLHAVRIAVFLSRHCACDHHGQPARAALGAREAAGLADERIGCGHPCMHAVGEPDDTDAILGAMLACKRLESRLRACAVPADRDNLDVARQVQQRAPHLPYRAHAATASREQHATARGIDRSSADAIACIADGKGRISTRQRAGKCRIDGNPSDLGAIGARRRAHDASGAVR